MGRIAAEDLVERLADWGVDTVFGLPGDGVDGVTEALRRHRDRVRFVLVHHEQAAAFMAAGHAKATGRLGVCLAASGPGGLHLMSGLHDARLDGVPVLAITGTRETSVRGTGHQQEVHLDRVYGDLAEYSHVIDNPVRLPGVVDAAVRAARTRRGVAHLTIPNDVQVADAHADPYARVAPVRPPAGAPVHLDAGCPDEADLRAAAEILNGGERVALLVGAGALRARGEVEQVADVLGAPVIKTLPGKAVLPDDSPYTAGGPGGLGPLDTGPSEDLVQDIDTLFVIGTNHPHPTGLPAPGSVRVVQVEADPVRAGIGLPTDVALVGDAARTLRALLPMLRRRSDRAHLEKYQRAVAGWREQRERMAPPDDGEHRPITPRHLMRVVDECARDDAVLTCDSGTIATWAARYWTIRGRREFYLSGNLAAAAPGLPYAIAVQHAFADRQVVAFVGDGGFAMLMAEFLTAAQQRLPVKVVVNNSNSTGPGHPEHGVRYPEPWADFAAWARSCGGFGAKVREPSDLRPAVREALAHDGPALVDVDAGPNEPPTPGKLDYEQASNAAQAFLRGQAHRVAAATSLFKDRIQRLTR